MNRLYNFSAGPSMLPLKVLEKAQFDLLSYKNTGQSVMEMSHRSKEYLEILNETKNLLKSIYNINDDYEILFLQGGASSQFSMVPLNLAKNKKADYILTGVWAEKAFSEAKRYIDAHEIASSRDKNYSYIPDLTNLRTNANSDYLHITLNNTIYGTCYTELPNTDNDLVCDFSSCALGGPLDVSKFSLLYGGAQKNMGIAGLCLVIIKKSLLGDPLDITPTMFNYKVHAQNQSLYNTPPSYAIYFLGLILKWIEEIGGLNEILKNNKNKANLLYNCLDESKLYIGTADKKYRSLFNVPFILKDENLNEKFLNEAKENGLINLKGHRNVGGMRASIYNGMPVEGVKKLVSFMQKFELNNK